MTNWLPDLATGSGPLYMRLADRIETDITGGLLPPGAKLPPQRDLAFDIGVTIGTIGRAYALVRERGLVSGEVGRGTFVLGRDAEPDNSSAAVPQQISGTRAPDAVPGKLVMDSTSAPDVGQGEIIGRIIGRHRQGTPGQDHRLHPLLAARLARGRRPLACRRRLEAGSRRQWCRPSASTLSAMAVIAAMTAPGDKVAFEQLTYSSISRSANLIGRRSVVVKIDEHGPVPEDFDRLCAQQHPKLAFLIPSLHNPTLAITPVNRRREIAEIARKHNVWLIEDSIYGALLDQQPTPDLRLPA